MERRRFRDQDVERIYRGAVKVLCQMGMKVENRRCLEALETFGCRIDYPRERALFTEETIERMLRLVRAEQRGWKPSFGGVPREFATGGGGTCPFYLDDERGERRLADEADCIQAFKIIETSPAMACEPPVYNRNCPPRFEAIRCLQLGIEILRNTTLGGIDLFFPEQVPFAADLGRLCHDNPKAFLPQGRCPTSPLIVSKTIADLAVACLPYNVPYAVPTMPVMGANAPLTPAGTAVIGVAEILGGYVLAKSLDPETPVGAVALSSLMDMRHGSMLYCAPEVFLADLGIAETLEYHLHLPCTVHGLYIDAKLPGMRATREKLLRCLGLGLFGNLSGMHGTLDQGKVFSPTQLLLDYDLHRFLASYTAADEVTDEALAIDTILEIGSETSGYLMHEHTLKHMRQAWHSLIFRPTHWLSMEDERAKEKEHLARARQLWVENLATYQPPDHPDDFRRELTRICDRAKKALS
jgi:trimethylamine:corrinoid methyltransferase-like protein